MAATAGASGAFIGTPAEVVLVRMTADGRLPKGYLNYLIIHHFYYILELFHIIKYLYFLFKFSFPKFFFPSSIFS